MGASVTLPPWNYLAPQIKCFKNQGLVYHLNTESFNPERQRKGCFFKQSFPTKMKSKLLSSRNRIHLQLHDYTQKIALNNSSQKVRILYKNPDKPLLLWVDGGILDFCCSDAGKYLDHYTDIFVVAYWQPELKAFNSVNQVLKCLFTLNKSSLIYYINFMMLIVLIEHF